MMGEEQFPVCSHWASLFLCTPCPYLSSATVGDCSFGSTTQQNRIIIETMAENVWENDDDLRLDRLRQHFHFYIYVIYVF